MVYAMLGAGVMNECGCKECMALGGRSGTVAYKAKTKKGCSEEASHRKSQGKKSLLSQSTVAPDM